MTIIVTRSGKGFPLTWAEADANFTNLNTDKAPINSPTFTGTVSGIGASNITLAPTGSISSTNVQAGIVELDSEKASLAGATFSGNVTVPKIQVGVSATASEDHFWDGSIPDQLSLKRGTPDAPGAELIKALNGVLSFPNQGQLIANPGFINLPGGLILRWGVVQTTATGAVVNFTFPTGVLVVFGTPNTNSPRIITAQSISAAGAIIQGWDAAGTQVDTSAMWIALGY